MADKENEDEFDYTCKIVLVGETSVGKTNILSRFCRDEFLANSKCTLGIEFATKVINFENKKIKLQIWDTAGQERYRALTNSFYKNSKGALLIYDITKFSTFEQIERWAKEVIIEAGEEIFLSIVGNKTDLKNIRAVSKEEGEYLANKLGNCNYIETSALNDTNIYQCFYELTESIYIMIRDL